MTKNTISKHWVNDRVKRNALIKKIGLGAEIKRVVLDKGHKKGKEVHVISSTGIITVFNQKTGKMVTRMIARPGKIKQYYREDEIIPDDLLRIAREHQRMKYHLV